MPTKLKVVHTTHTWGIYGWERGKNGSKLVASVEAPVALGSPEIEKTVDPDFQNYSKIVAVRAYSE